MEHYKLDKKTDNKGFSLIEVLIAMVILAIITLPILSSFSSAAKINGNARKQENANVIAQKMIEQYKSLSITQLTGSELGVDNPSINNSAIGVVSCDVEPALSTTDSSNHLIYTFRMASFNEDEPKKDLDSGESYYDGANGEKFFVEVTLDPTVYSNKSSLAEAATDNVSNNINSYNMPAFNDINTDSNYVIRYDIYKHDLGIITAFNIKGITGIAESDIKREVTAKILVDALPSGTEMLRNSAGTLVSVPIYKQTLSVEVKYIIKADTTKVVTYTNDYELSNKSIENAKEINSLNGLSGTSAYDEIKSIYIFYDAYDKYGSGDYVSADTINIDYDYNDLSLSEKLNVYLIQQDVKNINDNGTVSLDRFKVNVKVNGQLVTMPIYGTLNLDGHENLTGKVDIYSNITNWDKFIANQKNGITQNKDTTPSVAKYLYNITVKIWVGEKTGSPYMTMTSTKEN